MSVSMHDHIYMRKESFMRGINGVAVPKRSTLNITASCELSPSATAARAEIGQAPVLAGRTGAAEHFSATLAVDVI
jgi:hypothetical protein